MEIGNGTGPDGGDDAKGVDRGDDAERAATGDGVRGEPCGESVADVDQHTGTNANGGAEARCGVCCHGGGAPLDGAPAGRLHGAFVYRLPQVPGIETA